MADHQKRVEDQKRAGDNQKEQESNEEWMQGKIEALDKAKGSFTNLQSKLNRTEQKLFCSFLLT